METCPTDRTNEKHNEHSKEAARLPQAASLFAGSAYPAQYRHLKPSYPTAAHSSAPLFRVGQNRRRPDNDIRPVLRRLPKLEYPAGYGEYGMITKNSRQPVRPRSKRRCRKRGNRENCTTVCPVQANRTVRKSPPKSDPDSKARTVRPTVHPGNGFSQRTVLFRRTYQKSRGTVPPDRLRHRTRLPDRHRCRPKPIRDFEITLQMTILRKFACSESRTDGLRKIPEYILPGSTGIHGNAAPKIRNNETI